MVNPNWEQIYTPQANLNLQGNPALDDLRRTYATREQQRLQDNSDLTKDMAKLNFNGSRDADHPQLQNDYSNILNKFSDIRSINDPKERAAKDLELRQMQNQFLYNAAESKERNQKEQKLFDLTHNPNIDLDEGVPKKIQSLTQIANPQQWNSAYNDLNNNLFAPKFDLGKASVDAFNSVKSDSKTTLDPIKDPTTGLYKTGTVNTTSAPKDAYDQRMLLSLKGNHGAMKQIAAQYPGMDIGDATQKFLDDSYSMHKDKLGSDTTYGAGSTSMAQRLYLQERGAQLRQQYPSGLIPGAPPTPQVVPIKFQAKNADGSPVGMNLRNAVPIGIPKATVIPTKAIDDSGQEIQLPAGEYRVIEKGDKPVLNQDIDINTTQNGKTTTQTLKKGSLAQPGFEAKNPSAVTTEPVYHIQQDHGKVTKNYYVPQGAVSVNPSGQKNQTNAITTGAPTTNPVSVKDYNNITSGKDAKGNPITIGLKNGKWYDTKTHKVIE